ncbi:MAG: NADH-quinone oxidoreductase subunit M, partial [Rhodospirillaceae bacterium]|nr:NADH-quinone oxidoreductase subunit M [Rhodospirillaceae bacterium]
MSEYPVLSIVTFLPLIGVLFIFLIRDRDEEIVAGNARFAALFTSLFTFAFSLWLWISFDRTTADFQLVEKRVWIE